MTIQGYRKKGVCFSTLFSDSINEAPYFVDKTFWPIGCGRFYLTDLKKFPNRKKEFLREIKRELK